MNINIIIFSSFVEKILGCHPGKIVDIFSKKSNGSSFRCIGLNIGGIINIDPHVKVKGCVNCDRFPSRITISHHSAGGNNECFRKVEFDIEIPKLSIKLTLGMENICIPTIFIINHHFWIPLCHIILAFVIPGPFHHFTHMMGPVKINPNRLAGSYFFHEFCFQDGIINFVFIQDRYSMNPGSTFLGQGNRKIMDINLTGESV